MYMVVSKWAPKKGREDEWRARSAEARKTLTAIPGVEFMNRFMNEDGHVVVSMGYTDKPTYDRLVQNENGAVAKFMAESNIEDAADWISSERGESVD